MTETYAKALRDKRELERKLHNYSRDGRRNLSKIKQEKFTLVHGLHDVRSKTKDLQETISFIRQALREQKVTAEEELAKLASRRRTLTQKDVEREHDLMKKLELTDIRVRNIGGIAVNDQSMTAATNTTLATMIAKDKFKKLLKRAKRPENDGDATRGWGQEGQQQSHGPLPDNLPDLISFYVQFPPEHRVAIKRPKKTDFAKARLAKLQEDKTNALSNGTKTRLRRVDFHCRAIESVYLAH